MNRYNLVSGASLRDAEDGDFVLYVDALADKEAAVKALALKMDVHVAKKDEQIAALKEQLKIINEQRINLFTENKEAAKQIAALTEELKSLTEAYNNTDWKKKSDEQKEIINNLMVRWGKVLISNTRLRGEIEDALIKIKIDTGNRPGHEKWEYYCERLYNLHLIAVDALKQVEVGDES